MYVCVKVALCGWPMEKGIHLGLGEGSSGGTISQAHGLVPASLTLDSYLRIALSETNLNLGS